jgi:uncharacterized protein
VIAVDTTVLVYAVGSNHSLRDPCRALVDAAGDGRLSVTTTVEAIQEFAHVRARRRERAEAVQRAGEFAILLAPLLRPDEQDLRRGLELFAAHERLGAFDAVLAATVLRNERVTAIASADKSFGAVDGLAYLDPGAPDFLDQIEVGR